MFGKNSFVGVVLFFSVMMVASISTADIYNHIFSGTDCVPDPDSVADWNYTAWGLENLDDTYNVDVFCPIDWFSDIADMNYNLGTSSASVTVRVFDNHDSENITCRVYGSAGIESGTTNHFDYTVTSAVTSSGAGSPQFISFDADATFATDDGYYFVHCNVPEYENSASQIVGYYVHMVQAQ